MGRGIGELLQGLFVLFLALAMWRATGSWLGWLALFLPGAYFVLRGAFLVLSDDDG
jgi:hypothetical protein